MVFPRCLVSTTIQRLLALALPYRCAEVVAAHLARRCLRDPGALLRALHRGFEAGGGQVRAGESCKVEALCDGPSGGVLLDLAGGRAQDGGREAEFGHVVIAAGAHSAALAASVGDSVPLDTERGYHVVFPAGTEQRLTRAVCDPSEGFIMTPMSGGLRAAGRVELGGVQAPATPGRCDGLERAAASLFADALPSREPWRDWLGFRPTLPDALPVIGRSPRDARVVYAFGHQHVGWTLGGITGQLVAELVAGEAPSVDIAPFSVERFRWL
jgi:glycine/D-amino acid oxidase-like deaminating enzyme